MGINIKDRMIDINENGFSICFDPVNVSIKNKVDFIMFLFFSLGLNFLLFDFFFIWSIASDIILMIIIMIPPILFGIERRIEYANRKYHSGIIWLGVIIWFAILKFSGSIIEKGFELDIILIEDIIMIIVIMSFSENFLLNSILSFWGLDLRLDEDPFT